MKTSKALSFFLVMAAVFMLIACDSGSGGGDDGDDGDDEGAEVVFLDQNLQGEFNGKTYTFVSGYAEDSYFEAGSYDLELYNIEPEEGLDPWAPTAYPFDGYLQVMATVPAEIGRTDLFIDLTAGESKTVTLFDPDDNSLNIIAHIGAVEITEIDTAAGTLSGRIAASNGDGDEVNGNFTVPIAPAD